MILDNFNPEAIQAITPAETLQTQNPAAEAVEVAVTTDDFLKIPTATAPEATEKPTEKKTEQGQELTEAERKDMAGRNARMYVNLIDLIVSRGCTLLTGGEAERYKLSKTEREEYTQASADYFYTINAKVSPALVFMVTTMTIFSSIFFRAYADYKTKKRNEKQESERKEREAADAKREAAAREAEKRQQQERKPAPTVTTVEAEEKEPPAPKKKEVKIYREDIPEAMNKRNNFEIYGPEDRPTELKGWKDALIGKYKRAPNGDRWTYDECLKAADNTPSDFIKMTIQQYKEAGENWKEINLKIRRFLRELKPMILEGNFKA